VVPGRLLRSPARDTTSLPAPPSARSGARFLIHPARPPRPGAGFGASTDGPAHFHHRHLAAGPLCDGHRVRTAPRATRHPCAPHCAGRPFSVPQGTPCAPRTVPLATRATSLGRSATPVGGHRLAPPLHWADPRCWL